MLRDARFGCTFVVKTGVCEEKNAPVSIPLTYVGGALVPSTAVCRVVRERRVFPINRFQLGFNYRVFLCGLPTADFEADDTGGPPPFEVRFTDLSTADTTAWDWDFGDGGTSAEKNPAHTYQDAGTYTVVLTATNAAGSDVMTKTDYIEVATDSPLIMPTDIFRDEGAGSYAVSFQGDLGFDNRYSFWGVTGGEPFLIGDYITFTGADFVYSFDPSGSVYLFVEVSDGNGNFSGPGIAFIETAQVEITDIYQIDGTLAIHLSGVVSDNITSYLFQYSNDDFNSNIVDDGTSGIDGIDITVPNDGNWWFRVVGQTDRLGPVSGTTGPLNVLPLA